VNRRPAPATTDKVLVIGTNFGYRQNFTRGFTPSNLIKINTQIYRSI